MSIRGFPSFADAYRPIRRLVAVIPSRWNYSVQSSFHASACYIRFSMEHDSDALIVERVLAGDIDAFRALVDRYSDRLHHFCRARLGDDEDAEDAVQDVFVRAFRSLRSFDPSRNWASWLFTIAANRVKSRYAATASFAALVERAGAEASVSDELATEATDPAGQALDLLAAESLRAAIGALPKSLRAPVELYYFAGLSVADAAKALGLGEEAVKTRLFRARGKLTKLLGDSAQPAEREKGKH